MFKTKPDKLIHASNPERGRERLQAAYEALGYIIDKNSEHTTADILFTAKKGKEICVVVLLEQHENPRKLLHLIDLRNQLKKRPNEVLCIHHLDPAQEKGPVWRFLASFWTKLTAGVAVVVGCVTIWRGTHTASSPTQISPLPIYVTPAPSLPPGSSVPFPQPPYSPSVAKPPAPKTETSPPAISSEDYDSTLQANLQDHLRDRLATDIARRGLPTPLLMFSQSLEYTYKYGTANCTIYGSIVAGTETLLPSSSFYGNSNLGTSTDDIVKNACISALDKMIARYFAE